MCSTPTAEVYIGIGKPAEATACTQEAANLFPMSHNVLYMRGQVAELRGSFDEARRWYEEALSISPTHVKSMQRLVSLGPRPGLQVLRAGSPWKQQVAHNPHGHWFPKPTGSSYDTLGGDSTKPTVSPKVLLGAVGQLGQQSKSPCGSRFDKDHLTVLVTVIVTSTSTLVAAATVREYSYIPETSEGSRDSGLPSGYWPVGVIPL